VNGTALNSPLQGTLSWLIVAEMKEKMNDLRLYKKQNF
jgi:hypothetical protein